MKIIDKQIKYMLINPLVIPKGITIFAKKLYLKNPIKINEKGELLI